jgi:hypothetical protein
MEGEDLYSKLGVLPNTAEIVITASYRELAQRYHPDNWKGDPAEAHNRMCAINEAYSVLGDRARCVEYYDSRPRASYALFLADDNADQIEAFDFAPQEVKELWTAACCLYPDLKEHYVMLAQLSTALAYTYVVRLTSNKNFERRAELASDMRHEMFKRYFGSNASVNYYASWLIQSGQKPAAMELNRLVCAVGPEDDPEPIISYIDNTFGLRTQHEKAQKAVQADILRGKIYRAASVSRGGFSVADHDNYYIACDLLHALGYAANKLNLKPA